MRKWIYLFFGIMLIFGSLGSLSNYKQITDIWYLIGVLLMLFAGLFLVHLYSREVKSNKKIVENSEQKKKKGELYRPYLYSLIIVSIINAIFGTWSELIDNKILENFVIFFSILEVVLFVWSIYLIFIVVSRKLKVNKLHLVLPIVYPIIFIGFIIFGFIIAGVGVNVDEYYETNKIALILIQGILYLFIISWSIFVLKKPEPSLGQPLQSVSKSDDLKGIGGWLAFFLFTLFIMLFFNLAVGIKDLSLIISELNYDITTKASFFTLDLVLYLSIIFLLGYSIYLILKQKSNAIPVAKLALLAMFINSFILIVFSFLNIDDISDIFGTNSTFLVFRSLSYYIIWFLYLSVSKRVNNTFPKKERKVLIFDKIIFSICVLTTVVSLSIGFYSGFYSNTEAEDSQNIVDDWKDFNSIPNNFTVQFPNSPVHEVDIFEFPDFGRFLENQYYYSEDYFGTGYYVYITNYPENIVYQDNKLNLQAGLNSILNIPDFELINSSYDTFMDYDSLDYLMRIKNQDYLLKGKFIMSGNTLYQLLVAYDEQYFNSLDYDNFIDSFKPNLDLDPIPSEAPGAVL